MTGLWQGREISTNHPLDGLLEASGWYGKLFKGDHDVHPLLFKRRNNFFAVNPRRLPILLAPITPRLRFLNLIFAIPIFHTKHPKARLEMRTYRNKHTATMVYNEKPICDYFVKIDEMNVLGLMKVEVFKTPYAFILERQGSLRKK